jgi:hypothetical protein
VCRGQCNGRRVPSHNLEHLYPKTVKQLLYFNIEECLMVTVTTHSRHKSSFKHSKTIYVFTSGRVVVPLHVHSRKKILKELEWYLQNGHQYGSKAGFTLSCCKDLMKKGNCRCAVEMLLVFAYWCGGSMALNFVQILSQVCVQCLVFHHHIAFTFWCFEDWIWPKHGF